MQDRRQDGGARREEANMEFGYFTLSDNHYEGNTRAPNQFIADITAEAIYADQLGMHSAWIGEHHFNSLGVLSSPELVLAYIAARTKHIRLAPAVNVTPLHHPIRVAEQWATLDLLSNGRVDFASGPRLRQPRIRPVRRFVLRQPEHLRRGHGNPQGSCGRPTDRIPITASTKVRGRAHHAQARSRSRYRSISVPSPSLRSSSPRGSASTSSSRRSPLR